MEDSLFAGREFVALFPFTSQVAQPVKNLPAMRKIPGWERSPGECQVSPPEFVLIYLFISVSITCLNLFCKKSPLLFEVAVVSAPFLMLIFLI